MVISCNQWQSVAISAGTYPVQSVAIRGNQWESVAISGNQWQSAPERILPFEIV